MQATRHALARCYFYLATKTGPARRHAVPPGAHIPTSPSLTPPSSIVGKIVLSMLSVSAIQELLGASNIRKSTTDSIFNKGVYRHILRVLAEIWGGGVHKGRVIVPRSPLKTPRHQYIGFEKCTQFRHSKNRTSSRDTDWAVL